MKAEGLARAFRDGRAANVGAKNPYYGTGAQARMWRRGYRTMLVEMLKASPAARAYEAAKVQCENG